MPKITPFLWYDAQAEEAATLYCSIFPNSRILNASHYGDAGPGKKGDVMVVDFELDGKRFTAINAGPRYKFTEAVSFVVDCATQAEVDRYWNQLSAGGSTSMCGWLKDKFGLSWQIVPSVLGTLMSDPDPAKSKRVMEAMLGMTKLDIDRLKKAHAG